MVINFIKSRLDFLINFVIINYEEEFINGY